MTNAFESAQQENAEKPKPLDLKFYVTDHSADNVDTGDPERLKALYEDIKQDGVTSVRYDWHWNKVEPTEGGFQEELLGRYTKAVEIMNDAGLEPPTVILSNIPKWALDLYKEDKEKFFDEFRTYVEKVKENLVKASEKTGALVSQVQVLNELNNTVYTPIAAEDLPRLCAITREVLHGYNPDIELMGSIFAGNLPGAIKAATFGKLDFGIPVEEYLEKFKDALDAFDSIAVDYYPGMWHVPLGEARENKREIFKQLGLLRRTMETIAGWGKRYELGEVGIQTNIPLMTDTHNQDRQRYFYDVFFKEFRSMLLDFQEKGIALPERVGLYEAMDEPPKTVLGKILRRLTPFPENDMGMRKSGLSRKEVLKGNRHESDETKRGPSQLSKIIRYVNR